MAPSNAPVVLATLALLGTVGLVILGLVVAAVGAITGSRRLVRRALGGAAGLAATYLMVLGGVGLSSREKTLAVGSEKYFCQLDCHLAYSVVGLQPLPPGASDSRRWAVTLRTWFDQSTIAPWRPLDAPNWPNPCRVAAVDSAGRRYPPLAGAAQADSGSTPLTRELTPGESYTTTLVFELPAGLAPTRLLVESDEPMERLLIGNEHSLFHAATLLALPAPSRGGNT